MKPWQDVMSDYALFRDLQLMRERWFGERMKSYAVAAGLVFAAFFMLFLLVEWGNVPLLADPSPWMREAGLPAALLGVGFLVTDAVLPVPSSMVMIAHGAVFGVVLGTLLSLLGSLGAMLVGFAMGRRGGAVLTRCVSPRERATADRLLERYGALAIVVTRPVPLLAETVAVLAGASPLGWKRAMLAALIGSLPAAAIYALTGAAVVGVGNGALVFVAVVVLAGATWRVSRYREPRIVRDRPHALSESSSGMAS
jgi:uncharacterized membrane protein YdjX (TVP38/TMEM64 family)